MPDRKLRFLGAGFVTGAGAGALALAALTESAFAYGEVPVGAAPPPTPPIAEILNGTSLPLPGSLGPDSFAKAVTGLYIDPQNPFPGQPVFPGFTPSSLFVPEGLYPLTGVNTSHLSTSVSESVPILDKAITSQLAAGHPVDVFSYSQSTIDASLEMEKLDPSGTPSDLPVSFQMIADIMNPNGGVFERFPGLQLPSLGFDFTGATPGDDFHNAIYTIEYDGFADFPRYPIDFLSDLNALMGIVFLHGTYPDLTPATLATAIHLPTSGATETDYFMIPTQTLPLITLLQSLGVPKPLVDLIAPDLKVLVNLGYGADNLGYSDSPANVPTPFGLFPNVDPTTLFSELVTGARQGFSAFEADLSNPTALTSSLTDLANPLMSATADTPAALPSLTDIVYAFSSAASTAFSVLLPTEDFINAITTALPAYDASLFEANLSDPLDAFGLPIAANTGLLTMAGGFELQVLLSAAQTIAGDFSSLAPQG